MAAVQSLRPTTKPARTPEREALAAEIAAAWKATCAVTAAADALERGRAFLAKTEDALAAATTAVGDARARDVKAAAMAVKQRDEVAGASATRKARRELEDAEDGVEVARAAVGELELGPVDLEEKSRAAAIRVEAAINTVLANEAAARLVDELEKIKEEIPARQAALYFIRNRAFVDRVEIPALAAPLDLPKIAAAYELGLSFHPVAADQHPVAERWRAVVAALRGDADAALLG